MILRIKAYTMFLGFGWDWRFRPSNELDSSTPSGLGEGLGMLSESPQNNLLVPHEG